MVLRTSVCLATGVTSSLANLTDMTAYAKLPVLAVGGASKPKDHESTRSSLTVSGARCAHFSSLITVEESAAVVEAAAALGFSPVDWEYSASYRDCERVVAQSEQLAELLWHRLRPRLRREDVEGVRPTGWHNEGTWRPTNLNSLMRVSRYGPGHHFAPHRDGSFVLDDEHRSILTLLVYLDVSPTLEGGGTAFFHRGLTSGAPGKPAFRVDPRVGDAVLFTHDAWHQGEPVVSGHKLILRTDVMFERVAPEPLGAAYRTCATYKACEYLYARSIALQAAGDPAGSTDAYLAALELQAARSPSVDPSDGPQPGQADVPPAESSLLLALPIALLVAIGAYLDAHELLVFGACCSTMHTHVGSERWLWQRLFRRAWPHFHAQLRRSTGVEADCDEAAEEGEDAVMLAYDWPAMFRGRWVSERERSTVCFDVGGAFTRFAMVGGAQEAERAIARLEKEKAKVRGYYDHYDTMSQSCKRLARAHGLSLPECGDAAGDSSSSSASTSADHHRRFLDSELACLRRVALAIEQRGMWPCQSVTSEVGSISGHYWSAGSGYAQFLCAEELDDSSIVWGGVRQRQRIWRRVPSAVPADEDAAQTAVPLASAIPPAITAPSASTVPSTVSGGGETPRAAAAGASAGAVRRPSAMRAAVSALTGAIASTVNKRPLAPSAPTPSAAAPETPRVQDEASSNEGVVSEDERPPACRLPPAGSPLPHSQTQAAQKPCGGAAAVMPRLVPTATQLSMEELQGWCRARGLSSSARDLGRSADPAQVLSYRLSRQMEWDSLVTSSSAGSWQLQLNPLQIMLGWLMKHGFGVPLRALSHPVILAVPASTFCSQAAQAALLDLLFLKMHFPAVCLAPAPTLVLRAAGLSSGVVLDCGSRRLELSCVWEGALLLPLILELPLPKLASDSAGETADAEKAPLRGVDWPALARDAAAALRSLLAAAGPPREALLQRQVILAGGDAPRLEGHLRKCLADAEAGTEAEAKAGTFAVPTVTLHVPHNPAEQVLIGAQVAAAAVPEGTGDVVAKHFITFEQFAGNRQLTDAQLAARSKLSAQWRDGPSPRCFRLGASSDGHEAEDDDGGYSLW